MRDDSFFAQRCAWPQWPRQGDEDHSGQFIFYFLSTVFLSHGTCASDFSSSHDQISPKQLDSRPAFNIEGSEE